MHLSQQIPAPKMRVARRRRARTPATLLLSGTLLAGLTLLAACGGDGGSVEPPPPTPIPEQTYQVDFQQSTNDCSASNLDAFKGLAIPLGGGTSLLGLDTVPIPSTVEGDRITFSQRIPIKADTAVTFAGDWVFAADRHTFSGAVSFAVSFGGPTICTFTLATTGSHAPALASPTAPAGDPVSSRITKPEKGSALGLASASTQAATWGTTAGVIPFGGTCLVATNGVRVDASIAPDLPYPDARNARAEQEEDAVAFRWQLYGFSDDATAALSRILNATGQFETDGLLYESGWYWRWVFDPKPTYYAPPDWIDFRQDGTTFSQSNHRFVDLTGPGFYYVVLDVYWYDREGIGSGYYRNPVGETCHVPAP